MSDTTTKQKMILNSVMAKYDPENDVGSPQVTHTDVQLLIIVDSLLDRVDELTRTVDELETKVRMYEIANMDSEY